MFGFQAMISGINRNQRIMDRYNELIREPGASGHYETIFKIVAEEVDREIERLVATLQIISLCTDEPDTRLMAREAIAKAKGH